MIKQMCGILILLVVCGCTMTKDEITVDSLYDSPAPGGYMKIYSASYDDAYQAVLDVADKLNLVVELESKEDNTIILWGDMDEKIEEELVGVYFDPYHEKRTSIRIVTPSMKYEPNEWDEYDKADPWGQKIHRKLKNRLA